MNNRKTSIISGCSRWRHVVRGLHTVDHVLRGGVAETVQTALSIRTVVAVVVIVGPIYGLAMGSYAAVIGERSWTEQIPQMIFSATKVPILIGMTLLVSLPSFFVINSLLGLRNDFQESVRAIISAQAGLAIILGSLTPLTLFVYVSLIRSEISYSIAVLTNAVAFGIANVSAQLLLRGYYQPLVKRNDRHCWMIRFWFVVYAFVGIQAGYILRPFIGDPSQPTTFLRRDSFENAYVKILELAGNIVHRMWE